MNGPIDHHGTKSTSQPQVELTGREPGRRDRKTNAATGASAAGVRAIGSQVLAFYFRAPAKAFFRSRIDYLVCPAFARAINPHFQANEGYSLRISTPGLINHAVNTYGWHVTFSVVSLNSQKGMSPYTSLLSLISQHLQLPKGQLCVDTCILRGFIPNHVLPPILANIGIGAVLYTSYLQILGTLHAPSSQSLKVVYPPPPLKSTFLAGVAAGSIQSVVAAPLDALSVRFKTSEVLSGRYKTMWQYGGSKLREIGPRGIFAGWSLALMKDSLGYGAFFATFEYVKGQGYYDFVSKYYGHQRLGAHLDGKGTDKFIKPHWALPPLFLLCAGMAASFSQQFIQHPLSLVQKVHFKSLASLDRKAKVSQSKATTLRSHLDIYQKTYLQCGACARRAGGWRRWLYKGFLANTIKQVPSTSAGLVIFELVRRRYGGESDSVKIGKDGYYILLAR